MAVFKPFAAMRPAPEYTAVIAALPYDVYRTEEARQLILENPDSFLAVDLPEADPYEKDPAVTLGRLITEGKLVPDKEPAYYLYAQTMDGRRQLGLVGLVSVADYQAGVIRRHENTRREKEDGRVSHILRCKAHTGPIFLCCSFPADLKQRLIQADGLEKLADFTGPGGVRHEVSVIRDPEILASIEESVGEIPVLYIADGHHRAAAAARVGEAVRAAYPGDAPQQLSTDYFLSVLFDADDLKIFDYNRVILDPGAVRGEALLGALKEAGFTLEELLGATSPKRKGEFTVYHRGQWYRAIPEFSIPTEDPVASLDVEVLQRRVIAPIFGIEDPRSDARIDFVGGIRGLQELEKRAEETDGVSIALYPTSIHELMAVAGAHKLMPPKSTWFEPKLLSGLFLHCFEEELPEGLS